MMFQLKRYLPKTPTDWGAFLFLLFGIHSALIYEYFVILPFYLTLHPDFWAYTHGAAGIFLYINTMMNLWKVMTTDTSIRGMMMPIMLKTGWRFCTICECNSPPRSFHCFTCKTCLLKRDHHCNFTGNCIGYRNHRFYIMLVFYMWFAAVYTNIMNIDYVYHIFGGFSAKTIFVTILPLLAFLMGYMQGVSAIGALMTTLCVVGLLITTALLGYHSWNVYKGQIVHESTHKITDYDIGLKGNIQSVLGTKWYIAWVFPLIESPLPGDGLQFPKKGSYESAKDL